MKMTLLTLIVCAGAVPVNSNSEVVQNSATGDAQPGLGLQFALLNNCWPGIAENKYCAPCNGGDAASCDFSEYPPPGTTGCCEGLVCKWAGDNPAAVASLYTAICMSSSGPGPSPSPSPSPGPSPGPSPASTMISPADLAKAWKAASGGAYEADCANALAISFGEGVVKKFASPMHYIYKEGSTSECMQSPCWAAPAMTLDAFIQSSEVFDLDLPASDSQITVGPWQTTTTQTHGGSAELRVAEAIGYVQSCCMDGEVTVSGLPEGEANNWCGKATTHGDCHNSVDGQCNNPNQPGNAYYPVTTIFESHLNPALTWCGCATNITPNENHATTGYSGRCNAAAAIGSTFYSRYLSIANAACSA